MSSFKDLMKTTKSDGKNFPSTNQAGFCWQKYNEYVYCVKKTGGDEAKCKKLKQLALSICPTDWTDIWAEQRINRQFLGVQEFESPENSHH